MNIRDLLSLHILTSFDFDMASKCFQAGFHADPKPKKTFFVWLNGFHFT